MDFLTPLLIIIGFGAVLYLMKQPRAVLQDDAEVRTLRDEMAMLKANLEQRSEEVGKLEAGIEAEKSERNQQEGKGKALYAQNKQLEAAAESLSKENHELRARITKFEAEQTRREREFEDRITKLETAEQSLKQERVRVIREDEDRITREREEWDRMWTDHEISVISYMTNLCKDPAYAFRTFDNVNLPDDFDGALKPDFMVEFLGQYVVFDAKVSKAESLQTYITNNVKSTALKLKKSTKIYPFVFFVVPTKAISELKRTYFTQDGYTFYVVCPESVPVILASLKRISAYELADSFDPQEREGIVNLVSELDFHINLRNAADLFLSKLGTNILEMTEQLSPEMKAQVDLRKRELRSPFNLAEIKKMILSTTLQNETIEEMIAPRSAVKSSYVETVKTEVIQRML